MRCSWCGGFNHNRRGCHHRSEESKKRDPPKRPKTCSWCHSTLHTRPKCDSLKTEKQRWINENAAYRARFLADLKNINFNYGVIFNYSNKDILYFVESIDWDFIKHDNRWGYPIRAKILSNFDYISTYKFPAWYGMEEGKAKEVAKTYENNITVHSSVSEISIENYIPGDWLSGVSGVEEAFKK